MVRSAFGEAATLSTWAEGFDSPTDYCGQVAEFSRRAGLRSPCLRAWECDSPPGHCGVLCFGVAALHAALSRQRYGIDTRMHRLILRSGLESGFQRGLIS